MTRAATAGSTAIVLAGGSSRRFGGDKLAAQIAGRTVLDWTLGHLTGCAAVIVVGPQRPTETEVRFVAEDPPGGGPLAAIAAGARHVDQPVTWVLAGDQPAIGLGLGELRRALDEDPAADAALLVDDRGRRRYLAAAWRTAALTRRLAATAPHDHGAAHRLYADADVIEIADTGEWSADCDTPEQLAELAARFDR